MKDCCKDEATLALLTSSTRPDLIVKLCLVCGCKHYELTVEPGVLGLRGFATGGTRREQT